MSPAPWLQRNWEVSRFFNSRRALAPQIFYLLLYGQLAGCGAPGDPTPPTAPIPIAINDLAAHQLGDAVQLSFSLPAKSVEGDPLKEAPAVEILRAGTRTDGTPDLKQLQVVSTTPGVLVTNYISNGQVQLSDPISPEELKAHSGEQLVYVVRTRASKKRASANSNLITLAVYPTAHPVTGLEAKLTETAIELKWNASEKTSAGDPPPQPPTYRIYRGELNSSSAESTNPQNFNWISPPALLATTEEQEYKDKSFSFGRIYVYVVRAAIAWQGNSVESADSEPVTVVAKDIFPPGPPHNVVASVIPDRATGSPEVELSWAISSETDLAGYNVYRSEQEGTAGIRITPELLPTPALRDTKVEPGHRYWYTVTAVDSAGNESARSMEASVDVAQPTP